MRARARQGCGRGRDTQVTPIEGARSCARDIGGCSRDVSGAGTRCVGRAATGHSAEFLGPPSRSCMRAARGALGRPRRAPKHHRHGASTLWSLFTLSTAWVRNFVQLFIMRIGIGLSLQHRGLAAGRHGYGPLPCGGSGPSALAHAGVCRGALLPHRLGPWQWSGVLVGGRPERAPRGQLRRRSDLLDAGRCDGGLGPHGGHERAGGQALSGGPGSQHPPDLGRAREPRCVRRLGATARAPTEGFVSWPLAAASRIVRHRRRRGALWWEPA